MTNLLSISDLEIVLDDETGELQFGEGIQVESESVRTIGEMTAVLAQPEAAKDRADEIAYRLYRGISRSADVETFAAKGLRYDLSVTLPGTIGTEYIKTAGHIHLEASGGIGYPEIYDVLWGTAMFVVQWSDPLRLAIVRCEAGERVVLPPNASHLTVNIGSTPLVVADLVAIDSRNEYGLFQDLHGAAIYLLVDDDHPGHVRQTINHDYSETPTWRTIEGSRIGDFAPQDGHLYASFIKSPEDFEYLLNPEEYDADIQALWFDQRPEG